MTPRILRVALLVAVSSILVPQFAQAVLYAPGSTLNPACSPSDSTCGVQVNTDMNLDVFLIAGQSNAEGWGNTTSGPAITPGTAYQYYQGAVKAANDPVGNALTGSAWPQFAITYYAKTGRKVGYVPAAFGGTPLDPSSPPVGGANWSPTGTLFANSIAQADAAIAAFTAAGFVPRFAGVLWDQGENDADGHITRALYRSDLQTLINNYRAHFGDNMPFYIFRTGTAVGGNDSTFAEIRNAQEDVAQADTNTFIVFRNAVNFPSRGLMNGNYHYNQTGYNEMGRIGAETIANRATASQWASQSSSLVFDTSGGGQITIGTTTPSANALFFVGTSSPLFYVDKNGGIRIGTGGVTSIGPVNISNIDGSAFTTFTPHTSGLVSLNSGLALGNTDDNGLPGTIRWSGTDFLGNDGSAWRSLTGTTTVSATTLNYVKSLVTDVTPVSVVSTVAPTTIFTYTIPAGTLGTNKSLRLNLSGTYLNNSGATRTLTFTMKFGPVGSPTTVATKTCSLTTNAALGNWQGTFYLNNLSATSQEGFFGAGVESGANISVGCDDRGVSAIDTSVDETFSIQVTHNLAAATVSLTRDFAQLEMLNASDSIGSQWRTSGTSINYPLGNVGIGTSSPAQKLDVNGTIRQSGATNCALSTNASGDIICTSDANLKQNISPFTKGLSAIEGITPQYFEYKGESFTHAGFIAQNVETVLPDAVSLQSNGYLGLDTNAILAATVNAVKELNLKLDMAASSLSTGGASLDEFFSNLFARVSTWLGDAGNGIAKLFVKEVHTENLCVSDSTGLTTCIDKAKLDALLAGTNPPIPAPVPTPSVEPVVATATSSALESASVTPSTESTTSPGDATEATTTPLLPNTGAVALFQRVLEVGSSGDDVAMLQAILMRKGFLFLSADSVPGYFGELTRSAVAQYQSSIGLASSGAVGPLTRASLNAELVK